MKTILLTGSKGQLGIALQDFYKSDNEYQVVPTDIDEIDITDIENTREVIKRIKPDIIINCAAYTNVDKSEIYKEEAYNINVTGVKNLAIVSKEVDAVFVQISSDYVFDGSSTKPYIETDECNPLSIYGKTKYESEQIILNSLDKFFIVRTAWLYGEGNNFVRTMLKLAEQREKITVVEDQFGTPTSAVELAKTIGFLLKTKEYGVYHATCEGSCSWYEFAKKIFELTHTSIKVIPVSTEEYPSKVNRPHYSVLENKALKEKFNYYMPYWEEALEVFITNLKKG